MARIDWDRELREARKRRHGSIPALADPTALSVGDERELETLLDPLLEVVAEFRRMSRTQKGQRRSEFLFRLGKLRDQAVGKAKTAPNLALREAVAARAELVIEDIRADNGY